MDSHYVLTKAEKKDASFTARMKGNFIRSAQRLLPAQMGQYSVDLKNDPVYGFLANNVWVHDSRDGLKVQNELKLHNLKIAVDMQKASVEATDKEMREFAEQDFNPAMQEAERAKEAEARINATEKELKQHIEEEYKKKRAAFEESFAKYRSDMLGDLEERKAESRQRNDDAIRRLNQKTFQARAYVTSLKQQTQHRDVVEKELKEELEAAAEFDFIGCGANNILPGDLTGARIDLRLFTVAVLKGIEMFPIKDCNDIVEYLNNLNRSELQSVIVGIQNLGVQENPKFRKEVKLAKRLSGETKHEMIVRIVKAIMSKDLELPESVQILEEECKKKRQVARAKRQREEGELAVVTEDRRPQMSDENIHFAKDFDLCYTPSKKRRIRINAPGTPLDEMSMLRDTMPSSTDSKWKMDNFDDSNLDMSNVFSNEDCA